MNLIIEDEELDNPFHQARSIKFIIGTDTFINNQRLLLIYPSKIDKCALRSFITSQLDEYMNQLDFCRIGHSVTLPTSIELSRSYTYVILELDMIYPIKNRKIFDTQVGEADIRIPVSRANWDACVRYLSKIDQVNFDLSTYQSDCMSGWQNDVLLLIGQVIQSHGPPQQAVSSVHLLHNPPQQAVSSYTFGRWDRGIWIKGSPSINHLKGNIVYDPQRCGEKTSLIKTICLKRPDITVSLSGVVPEDITFLVSAFPSDELSGKIAMVQLNHMSNGNEEIYDAIELVRDGVIGNLIGLWLFTTWLPKATLSQDKWCIWKVEGQRLVRY